MIGGAAAILGGFDGLLQTLVILMAIDLITGILSAWKNQSLNARKGWFLTAKKLVTMLLIVMATKLDQTAGTGAALRSSSLLYFIANEGLSVLENAQAIGLKIPEQIRAFIEKTGSNKGGNYDDNNDKQ